ncbi:MAG: hypothetical protein JWM02_1020 [Frankiales bacterium]|nr:hypothetical protein [Frankiales bacterium]
MRRHSWTCVLVLSLTLLSVEVKQAPVASASAPGLAITAPTSVSLGSVASTGGTLAASLGNVTVSTAGLLSIGAAWTATASASAFTTGGGSAAETIPAANVSYLSGPSTASSGINLSSCAAGQLVSAVSIGASQTGFGCAGLGIALGGTSLTWRPTITITLPAAVVAGTYQGTITHSVA